MPDMPVLLEVENLTTHFAVDGGVLAAVDGVSFALRQGEILGIVGESGSGKSVLARSILGLHSTASVARAGGRVWFDGVDLRELDAKAMRRIWGRRTALILQDPMQSLNPVMRVGHQITEGLRLHLGLSRTEADARALALLGAVGIPDPQRRSRAYPHQLSGGQRQRVTIAIAIACEPEMLIADEPTTALDVTVQAQILDLLQRLCRERGMAMIIISHNLGVVASFADRIAVMYAGQFVEEAPAPAFFTSTATPYAQALLESSPRLTDSPDGRLPVIAGRPPDLARLHVGCRFAPRCRYARPRCATDPPSLDTTTRVDHAYRCWYPLGQRNEPDGDGEGRQRGR
jgi:oligopeptide/dipeptide ABC transporter ATP-binding protein